MQGAFSCISGREMAMSTSGLLKVLQVYDFGSSKHKCCMLWLFKSMQSK